MKVLIINGSPRVDGNTSIAVNEMVKIFEKEGVEAEVMQIGTKDVRGCIACNKSIDTILANVEKGKTLKRIEPMSFSYYW